MPGFSLTVLLLPREGSSSQFSAEKIIKLLDAPTDAPGWPWHPYAEPTPERLTAGDSAAAQEQNRRNLPVLKRTSL